MDNGFTLIRYFFVLCAAASTLWKGELNFQNIQIKNKENDKAL